MGWSAESSPGLLIPSESQSISMGAAPPAGSWKVSVRLMSWSSGGGCSDISLVKEGGRVDSGVGLAAGSRAWWSQAVSVSRVCSAGVRVLSAWFSGGGSSDMSSVKEGGKGVGLAAGGRAWWSQASAVASTVDKRGPEGPWRQGSGGGACWVQSGPGGKPLAAPEEEGIGGDWSRGLGHGNGGGFGEVVCPSAVSGKCV